MPLKRIAQKKWLPKLLKHLDRTGGACDLWKVCFSKCLEDCIIPTPDTDNTTKCLIQGDIF